MNDVPNIKNLGQRSGLTLKCRGPRGFGGRGSNLGNSQEMIGRTPRGSCNNAPFEEGFLEGLSRLLSRRVLRRRLAVGFRGKKGSEKGSSKGFKEGAFEKAPRRQKHAFSEYDPLGVRPKLFLNRWISFEFCADSEANLSTMCALWAL